MKRDAQGAERHVTIPAGRVRLEGDLAIPAEAPGLVLFVHGSGSSRLSPRNRFVAARLREAGLGTLLMDLLTAGEEAEDLVTRALRFDIPFLAGRVRHAAAWLTAEPATRALKVGYFGSSTGAAAALVAAAETPERVAAIVSRGGRPDLAADALSHVRAPTLLVVGGDDLTVLDLNRLALERLRCERNLVVVPGASHLFEEPGTLEAVAEHAARWFQAHLGAAPAARKAPPK